jgi:hypothetical protein
MKEQEKTLTHMQRSIGDVHQNIKGFMHTREQLLAKLNYLSGNDATKKNFKKMKQAKKDEDVSDKKEEVKERKSLMILKDIDPDAKESQLKELFEHVSHMLKLIGDKDNDPYNELVTCLSQIESALLFNIEARNHLHWKDSKIVKKNNHIEELERHIQKTRTE